MIPGGNGLRHLTESPLFMEAFRGTRMFIKVVILTPSYQPRRRGVMHRDLFFTHGFPLTVVAMILCFKSRGIFFGLFRISGRKVRKLIEVFSILLMFTPMLKIPCR